MPNRDLTPAEEEQVRRLLADARHRAPVPEEVAARLDDVLTRLQAERAATDGPTTDELASRRRRRRLGAGLLAAAAVVVAGVSLPQLLGSSGSDEASTSADRVTDGGMAEMAPESAAEDRTPQDRLRALARDAQQGRAGPQHEACPRRPAWGPGEVVDVEWDGREAVVVLRSPQGGRQRVDLYLCGSDRQVRHTTVAR